MPRHLRPVRPAPLSRIAAVGLILEDMQRRGLVQARMRPDGKVGYWVVDDPVRPATPSSDPRTAEPPPSPLESGGVSLSNLPDAMPRGPRRALAEPIGDEE